MTGSRKQNKDSIHIRVPGTSANLGPGFDVLGLALKIYNDFYFDFGKEKNFSLSLRNGTPLPFSKDDDLIFKGYQKYFEIFIPGKEPMPYNVNMTLGLPLKGGLGSSASALVAGFGAANYIHKKYYSKIQKPKEEELLFHLAMMEGHPDNTTPAWTGGFVFAFFSNQKLIYFKEKFSKDIQLWLFVPSAETDTNASRKKLPDSYPVKDVIFNMARIGTWIQVLKNKKINYLSFALEDKIHTDYRISSVPVLVSAKDAIIKSDALFSLSGSGPSILIYGKKSKSSKIYFDLKKNLDQSMNSHGVSYSIFPVETDYKGMRLNRI